MGENSIYKEFRLSQFALDKARSYPVCSAQNQINSRRKCRYLPRCAISKRLQYEGQINSQIRSICYWLNCCVEARFSKKRSTGKNQLAGHDWKVGSNCSLLSPSQECHLFTPSSLSHDLLVKSTRNCKSECVPLQRSCPLHSMNNILKGWWYLAPICGEAWCLPCRDLKCVSCNSITSKRVE